MNMIEIPWLKRAEVDRHKKALTELFFIFPLNNEEINRMVTVEELPQMWGKKIAIKCICFRLHIIAKYKTESVNLIRVTQLN